MHAPTRCHWIIMNITASWLGTFVVNADREAILFLYQTDEGMKHQGFSVSSLSHLKQRSPLGVTRYFVVSYTAPRLNCCVRQVLEGWGRG